MDADALYKYAGLLAFLVLLAGLSFIIWRWPEGKHRTFSQHVAAHKHRVLYYILLFSVALPLLLAFFFGWFIPTFRPSAWFGVFVVLSSITQFACTLIPEVGGPKTVYHQLLAGISGISLLPALLILLTTPGVTRAKWVVTLGAFVLMAGIACLALIGKGKHSHLLFLQAGYFAAFFAAILFVSYV